MTATTTTTSEPAGVAVAAQQVARDFATTRLETIPRATTIRLVRVSVEMASHPSSPVAASQSSEDAGRPPVVVVQYLRN